MRLLAIETSGDWCSVAVGDGGTWHSLEEHAAQAHSERALVLVDSVLASWGIALGNLDGIAFGAGPGSFTGVRLACAIAQGLAFGADLPTVGVCTLAALAQSCWRKQACEPIIACIDARVREVYVAAYARTGDAWIEAAAPRVMAPSLVTVPERGDWVGAGNGFEVDKQLGARLGLVGSDATARATAQSIGELALPELIAGRGLPAGEARPLYVRHRVALTTAEREAGARL